jgi:hypothetical protein
MLEAAAALDHAQVVLRAFTGLDSEPTAIERLRELREARDAARDLHEQLAAHSSAMSIAVDVGDWDDLSHGERRKLIRAVIVKVTVAPGRGSHRIEIEPRMETRLSISSVDAIRQRACDALPGAQRRTRRRRSSGRSMNT